MTSPQTIPIDSIDAIDGIWQLCSEYDAMLIAVYKEALNEGVTLPPIAVFQVREKRFLADGQHRLRAHKELGRLKLTQICSMGRTAGMPYRVRGSPCPLQRQRPRNSYSKGKNMTCWRGPSHDLIASEGPARRTGELQPLSRGCRWCAASPPGRQELARPRGGPCMMTTRRAWPKDLKAAYRLLHPRRHDG